MAVRLPAEWEEQDGVLLAWPHKESDWCDDLHLVEPVFMRIAQEISRFERVLIVAPETAGIAGKLRETAAVMDRIVFRDLPTNDTWSRDFGPITIRENDQAVLLDFGFNGWGLKFASNYDNRITAQMAAAGIFGDCPVRIPGLILEGGSIESDGNGTILTTAECLLNPNRNPHLDRKGLESQLNALFGSERFLWLENGYLAGDDTDSHIDTLARFCPGDTIAYVRCDDRGDEHFEALCRMEEELKSFRTQNGAPYRLVPLPWPNACIDQDGERLPATYANFLIINDAVLVPTYNDAKDAEALEAVASAFPDREIIGIDCAPLVLQHGSLHCVTMQLPKGVLA